MAHYLSFTCLFLTVLVLSLFDSTQQAPYHPYFNPFGYHYPTNLNPYMHQARLNFNSNDLNSLLVRTATSTTRTTITTTTTFTCTRSTTACDSAGAQNSLRFPFLSGLQKRSLEEWDLEDLKPSEVVSVEPTSVPEERVPRITEALLFNPYGIYPIDSSLSREIHPAEASQARLFFGITTTITISATVISSTTKTLTPGCSLAGFFSQC